MIFFFGGWRGVWQGVWMGVMYPEQELRFTRSRQGAVFAVLGAFFAGVSLVFGLCGWQWARGVEVWYFVGLVLVFLGLAGWCGWMGWRCLRYAYVLLSPVGVEIFPLFGVEKGMRVVAWAEVRLVEWEGGWLILHFTVEKTAGVQLSMSPLFVRQRELLRCALEGRMEPLARQVAGVGE